MDLKPIRIEMSHGDFENLFATIRYLFYFSRHPIILGSSFGKAMSWRIVWKSYRIFSFGIAMHCTNSSNFQANSLSTCHGLRQADEGGKYRSDHWVREPNRDSGNERSSQRISQAFISPYSSRIYCHIFGEGS